MCDILFIEIIFVYSCFCHAFQMFNFSGRFYLNEWVVVITAMSLGRVTLIWWISFELVFKYMITNRIQWMCRFFWMIEITSRYIYTTQKSFLISYIKCAWPKPINNKEYRLKKQLNILFHNFMIYSITIWQSMLFWVQLKHIYLKDFLPFND